MRSAQDRDWILTWGDHYGGVHIITVSDSYGPCDDQRECAFRFVGVHFPEVAGVALLSSARTQDGGWVLASAGTSLEETGGSACITRAACDQGEGLRGIWLNEYAATRHSGNVNRVALAASAGPQDGGWLLASGGDDGIVRVARASECDEINRDRVRTELGSVTNLDIQQPLVEQRRASLPAAPARGRELSFGTFKMRGRVSAKSAGSTLQALMCGGDPLGHVATRHAGAVKTVALSCDRAPVLLVSIGGTQLRVTLCGTPPETVAAIRQAAGGTHRQEVLCLPDRLVVATRVENEVRVAEYDLENFPREGCE